MATKAEKIRKRIEHISQQQRDRLDDAKLLEQAAREERQKQAKLDEQKRKLARDLVRAEREERESLALVVTRALRSTTILEQSTNPNCGITSISEATVDTGPLGGRKGTYKFVIDGHRFAINVYDLDAQPTQVPDAGRIHIDPYNRY